MLIQMESKYNICFVLHLAYLEALGGARLSAATVCRFLVLEAVVEHLLVAAPADFSHLLAGSCSCAGVLALWQNCQLTASTTGPGFTPVNRYKSKSEIFIYTRPITFTFKGAIYTAPKL